MSKMRSNMASTDRAKQFAPFAALKGHEMELAKKREIIESRIELAEDEIESINECLGCLNIGDEVRVTYYDKKVYVTMIGNVEKIYIYESALQIKSKKIEFKDIYRIEKMGL
ncbi:MAG: YolD-like family protein [Firmicutes bacterium]|nr:YolD-like family protein [Bacillota bacterium]